MFSEKLVQFYAAEVTLAIEHLHSMNIIHRDLKVTDSLSLYSNFDKNYTARKHFAGF